MSKVGKRRGAGDMKKKRVWFAAGAIAVILLIFVGMWAIDHYTVDVPKYPAVEKTVWLEQNWTQEQRDWFHHANQGTETFDVPYEWFVALEQPALSFTGPGLLSDPEYLDRFGFIPDNTNPGKPELPIGFAHSGAMRDANGIALLNPRTNAQMTSLGLTCAACHTGRFTYQKTAVLIDGGPALTNLNEFQIGVGLSLLYTRYVPWRFDRFANRVLGTDAGDEAKSELRKQMDPVVAKILKIRGLEGKVKQQTVEEGFARLDALNRIGNVVFAIDLDESANWVGFSAPVHFPRIWQASWFEWVQYNGSIHQPMTRNAGESLGVGVKVNLTGSKDQLFNSTAQIQTIYELEQTLAGTPPPNAQTGFNGLNSPKWPANILPPINAEIAAKGAVLYKELCQGCHLPPVKDPAFWTAKEWSEPNSAGERFLDLKMIDIKEVGTDPAEAEDMKNRTVAVPPSLGITSNHFGTALGQVVGMTVDHWYESQQPPISPAMQEQMNGNRPGDLQVLLKYKVRPLNGIWATPPYLHNGSVPNLYALLSPVAERPKKFYLGNREYDPVNVGYHTGEFPGGFKFDTTIRGNSNFGHEFNDPPIKDGVIGRLLRPDERWALIEYLKTL
jgi:hypothetical protein